MPSMRMVAGVLGLLVVSAPAFARGDADFNGDGFADLAIGLPGDKVGTLSNIGSVFVIYGSASGPTGFAFRFNHPSPESGDDFGHSLAWGDINGDGYTDLAIGAPGDDVSFSIVTYVNAGSVTILYGSAAGLTTSGRQLITGAFATGGVRQGGAAFGSSVAMGDFWPDGKADLAVGAPYQNDGPAIDCGTVSVFRGTATGIVSAQSHSRTILDYAHFLASDMWFGFALATGDFDGDGDDDLAMGAPGARGQGIVLVTYNPSAGSSAVEINEGFSGNSDELFGRSLAAGDFDGNGKDDLAIGVPLQDVGGAQAAGEVVVLPGTASGLNLAKPKFWNQNTVVNGVAIKDKAETNDFFGDALATGDINGDGRDELIVGVPSEDAKDEGGINRPNTGMIHVISGSATGLTAAGNKKYTQATSGIEDTADNDDKFGYSLTTGDYNNDGKADLCIGIPGESTIGGPNEGAVITIHGSATGLNKATNDFKYKGTWGYITEPNAYMGAGIYGP